MLGKFLYNKRLLNSSVKANAVSCTYAQMRDPSTRPKFYESHTDVLRQTQMDPQQVQLYLHHNMPDFFGSIEDLAEALDTFS